MRAARLAIAVIMLTPILLVGAGESIFVQPAFGQIGGPPGAPGAPLAPPAAPGAPQALPTVGALPQLAPAPGARRLVQATPLATPRVFRCTCSGPGFPTAWTGRVPAPSYIIAREQASRACLGFVINAHAQSPFINPPGSGFTATRQNLPGTLNSLPPGQVTVPRGTILPGLQGTAGAGISKGQLAGLVIPSECQQCACD
jgi:hypothetical protein